MPPPEAIWPQANTRSLGLSQPVASRASTIHASTDPVWKVKPKPRMMLAPMNPQIPRPQCGVATYNKVETIRVTKARRTEARRPIVSATTPVGTSKARPSTAARFPKRLLKP